MIENIANPFQKYLAGTSHHLIFLIMAIAIFRTFSKVDFYVIVQKENARASNSGFLQKKCEKTNFPMKTIVPFIVSFLGFERNNKKPMRKLNE